MIMFLISFKMICYPFVYGLNQVKLQMIIIDALLMLNIKTNFFSLFYERFMDFLFFKSESVMSVLSLKLLHSKNVLRQHIHVLHLLEYQTLQKFKVFVLILSDWVGGLLFAQPRRVNRLPIFYGWAFQIQYLMVFQVEVLYICLLKSKTNSLLNIFRNLNFSKCLKHTSGPIGLIHPFTG